MNDCCLFLLNRNQYGSISGQNILRGVDNDTTVK